MRECGLQIDERQAPRLHTLFAAACEAVGLTSTPDTCDSWRGGGREEEEPRLFVRSSPETAIYCCRIPGITACASDAAALSPDTTRLFSETARLSPQRADPNRGSPRSTKKLYLRQMYTTEASCLSSPSQQHLQQQAQRSPIGGGSRGGVESIAAKHRGMPAGGGTPGGGGTPRAASELTAAVLHTENQVRPET